MNINNLPVLPESEIIVCGGGPAGAAAALTAARAGHKVVLLEKGGACGGQGTLGLVPMIYVGHREDQVFTSAICKEIVEESCRQMGIERSYSWQTTDPEIMKRIYDDKLEEAGVRIFYDVKIAAVNREDSRIDSVIAATSQGLKAVKGKIFIDATGDGAVSAFAGVPFEFGDKDGNTMSPTLCIQYSNVDLEALYALEMKLGTTPRSIWLKLQDEGKAPVPEYHFVGVRAYGHGSVGGNLGHIYGTNCIDESDVTRAYIEGRRLALTYFNFYREYVPGFAKADLVNTASLLSMRETRRVSCDYQLNMEDYLKRAIFDDEIGRFSYPVDIHSSSTDAKEQKMVEERMTQTRYEPGESYGVPYRSLCAQGVDNLLVAGRCICSDRAVQASIRVISGCFLTGQGAGAAAGLALSTGDIRKIDISALKNAIPKVR